MPRSIAVLGLLLSLATPAFAQPTVPVTTCGQSIPAKAIGVLTGDLDCTGYAGGDYAVVVGKRATFDLAGFTVTGAYTGAGCVGLCPNGNGLCFLQCSIKNGIIEGGDYSGISGDRVAVENVTIRDCGRGIDGGRRVKVIGSTITDNELAGVLGRVISVEASTVTGNGRVGILTSPNGSARVKDSTVIGNDTSPECAPPASASCFDIGSARRPRVINTTCDKSYNPNDFDLGGCDGWCVCAGDQP